MADTHNQDKERERRERRIHAAEFAREFIPDLEGRLASTGNYWTEQQRLPVDGKVPAAYTARHDVIDAQCLEAGLYKVVAVLQSDAIRPVPQTLLDKLCDADGSKDTERQCITLYIHKEGEEGFVEVRTPAIITAKKGATTPKGKELRGYGLVGMRQVSGTEIDVSYEDLDGKQGITYRIDLGECRMVEGLACSRPGKR